MAIQDAIERSVNRFVRDANNTIDYLTEDDMRCRLFKMLLTEIPEREGSRPVSIHSEVRWYGDRRGNRRPLKYRSDVVIIDNTTLREGSVVFGAPSKGFGFNEYYGIIELKLRRQNGASDNALLRMIASDIEKLQSIGQYTSPIHNPVFYLIVFDKKRDIRPVLPSYDGVRVLYKYFDPTSNCQNDGLNSVCTPVGGKN